jgi:SNF2 family DNA or RNA helicase
LQVIDNKALLLKLRDPAKVTSIIPKSKSLADNQVLVNWGLSEAHVLNNLSISAPSPIEGRYEWTGKYAPFEHQKTTSSFLTLNKRAFCFNEQGTGKTASAIWSADYLLKQGEINRVLIICPLSIMESAWRDDLFTFAMHRTVDVAYGSAKKRKDIIASGVEFVIINYDGVEIVEEDIRNGGFDLIIADEATHYKNVQTKRWKALNRLITPKTWLWMMTGTPAAQSPLDAYGLAKLINPTAVPRFFSSFRDQVMHKITNFKWIPKADATDRVFNALQPAKVLREVIDESSKKVLVFVPFKHSIDVLTSKLRKENIPTEMIRGDVPVTKRTEIFKAFQTEAAPQVLIVQPQAAAHGVTLTAANTVVWWGPVSSLETYAQANARVHRTGQDHKCTVVQLQGSPVEKKMYALLDNRINIHTKIVDLYKELLD